MFSNAVHFLKEFARRDEGELSIGHCLTGAVIAVFVVASIMSISPDVKRIYGAGTGVSKSQSRDLEMAVKVDQAGPGVFAHISQR